MELNNLKAPEGARKNRTRVGRGQGSGKGKTCGRGEKGQKSRSGGQISPGFEGGQMPLHRRLPKRGFKNRFAKEWSIVNVGELERRFDDGAQVDADALAERGLIWSRTKTTPEGETFLLTRPLKILAEGTLTKSLTVVAQQFSKAAEAKIAAAGGSAKVV